MRLAAYVELLRPPNLATSAADVLAGLAVATWAGAPRSWWLVPSSVLLYAGGVVLNDVFDAGRDARERPERPIPSRRASRAWAGRLGGALLLAGCVTAAAVGPLSGAVAVVIAGGATAYDVVAKDHVVLGPVTMGACRALNLLLGISAAPAVLSRWWPLALIPLLMVAAITLLSRGETDGGHPPAAAPVMLLAASGALAAVAAAYSRSPVPLLLACLLAFWTLTPAAAVWMRPTVRRVRLAVTAGVLGLPVLDAALASTFADPIAAAPPLTMLPLGLLLARFFAAT
jgi:4-hydroxybenzoate polyprenyltransferase